MTTILVTERPSAAAYLHMREGERLDEVAQAHSGPEALTLVGLLEPDVVVLDLGLPGFDGLGCVREIIELHPSVDVVVVLDSADRSVMQAAFQRGACGCVVRARDGSDLSAAVMRALAGAAYEEDWRD